MTTNIIIGDCREKLKELPDQSVHCCVTSPPYYGLRDYGVDGQIGIEQSPNEYVDELTLVFREVRRVLRDDGTLWLNLGDSYASSGGERKYGSSDNGVGRADGTKRFKRTIELKPKDLIGIPWMVAFALRDDGWYLRQDIIWNKPSAMPESVMDRCTKSHEYLFLLSKSEKYYFDQDAIKEKAKKVVTSDEELSGSYQRESGRNDGGTHRKGGFIHGEMRNKRSVWTVSSQPYSEAHFATFPPKLIEPCILAGCPQGGTVLDPFGGSGTSGKVANAFGRNAILIELNPKYIDLAQDRTAGLFNTVDWSSP